jgi:hypothetical protein
VSQHEEWTIWHSFVGKAAFKKAIQKTETLVILREYGHSGLGECLSSLLCVFVQSMACWSRAILRSVFLAEKQSLQNYVVAVFRIWSASTPICMRP